MKRRDYLARPLGSGVHPRIRQWLEYEQTVNERLIHEIFLPHHHHNITVRSELRPERRPVWPQEVVWLPLDLVRTYGPVEREFKAAFGIGFPDGRAPLLLHPQATLAHRALGQKYGRQPLGDVVATPTSSYRSVLAWSRARPRRPVGLKLSIGALIGGRRRSFREKQIARAIMINSLFETIPPATRKRLRFDWFAESAAVVDTVSERGWLLRRLPEFIAKPGATTLIPAFSLISRRADRVPLLVELIRNSGQSPEAFVLEHLLQPYVKVLAYLLFGEGLQYEGHTQNVLFEIAADDSLTGRLVLRDMADTTVNLAFRLATGGALPTFPAGFLPQRAPFPIAGNAADYRCDFDTSRVVRALDTVERYGLWGFVWPINTSLARFFKKYDARKIEEQYLELWQQAAVKYLDLRPLFRKKPKGLATDEAFSYFLQQTDWRALGARPAHLPADAEALLIEGRMRRRVGRVYERLECAWGDLFIYNGLPGFFRPAF